jgi:hypothetical protein
LFFQLIYFCPSHTVKLSPRSGRGQSFLPRAAAAVNHYSHCAAAAVNSLFIISFFCLFENYEASKPQRAKPA